LTKVRRKIIPGDLIDKRLQKKLSFTRKPSLGGSFVINDERFVARSEVWIEVGTQVIIRKIEFNQLIVKPLN